MTGGLAELLFRTDEVADVVPDLESHPESVPEVVQRLDLARAGAGHQGPDPSGGGHEGSRLPGDGVQVRSLGPGRRERVAELGELALAQPPDGPGEDAHDFRAELGRNLRGPGQQEVTGQDGHQVAPAGVGALHPSSRAGFVDYIVVVQRAHVDQLDGDGALDDRLTGNGACSRGGSDQQGWSEPFAAGVDEVGSHFGQKGIGGQDRPAQLRFDPGQAFVEPGKVEELPDVHYKTICQRRAQVRTGLWAVGLTGVALTPMTQAIGTLESARARKKGYG